MNRHTVLVHTREKYYGCDEWTFRTKRTRTLKGYYESMHGNRDPIKNKLRCVITVSKVSLRVHVHRKTALQCLRLHLFTANNSCRFKRHQLLHERESRASFLLLVDFRAVTIVGRSDGSAKLTSETMNQANRWLHANHALTSIRIKLSQSLYFFLPLNEYFNFDFLDAFETFSPNDSPHPWNLSICRSQ